MNDTTTPRLLVDLDAVRRRVRERGPNRVLVNIEGEAHGPAVAARDHGTVADIVFVRWDGWTLGAPRHLAEAARALWAGNWVATLDRDGRDA